MKLAVPDTTQRTHATRTTRSLCPRSSTALHCRGRAARRPRAHCANHPSHVPSGVALGAPLGALARLNVAACMLTPAYYLLGLAQRLAFGLGLAGASRRRSSPWCARSRQGLTHPHPPHTPPDADMPPAVAILQLPRAACVALSLLTGVTRRRASVMRSARGASSSQRPPALSHQCTFWEASAPAWATSRPVARPPSPHPSFTSST